MTFDDLDNQDSKLNSWQYYLIPCDCFSVRFALERNKDQIEYLFSFKILTVLLFVFNNHGAKPARWPVTIRKLIAH